MGFWDGSSISWTICKQSTPLCRQITTPTPHHSIFTGQMLFLTLSQQCQSTECNSKVLLGFINNNKEDAVDRCNLQLEKGDKGSTLPRMGVSG